MKRVRRKKNLGPLRDSRINDFPTVFNPAGDIIYVLDEDGREITLDEFLENQKEQEITEKQ